MLLTYLPTTQAWCVTFGDTIVDIDGIKIWTDRSWLICELARLGLDVDSRGRVGKATS